MKNSGSIIKNGIIIFLLLCIVGLSGWIVWLLSDNKPLDPPTSIPPTTHIDTPEQPSTIEFSSPKGVTVRLDTWTKNKVISSPATITGEIPGNWSFEADFLVMLTDWDGQIIAQQPAQLTGDWMTTDYVPFTVTLSFESPALYNNGALILRKDNPSGLPEYDDAIEIPITYE
ncbi:hypothetical protein EOL96_05175 [Candidatus Saccharibacteria bacterium]|nr:hypothetical protein [Candidatus Saccharibacteria bacterium]